MASQLALQVNALQPDAPSSNHQPIGIIEPSKDHFYQPLWTLVGGGLKSFDESRRPMSLVMEPLKQNVQWLQDRALRIDPAKQLVELGNQQLVRFPTPQALVFR